MIVNPWIERAMQHATVRRLLTPRETPHGVLVGPYRPLDRPPCLSSIHRWHGYQAGIAGNTFCTHDDDTPAYRRGFRAGLRRRDQMTGRPADKAACYHPEMHGERIDPDHDRWTCTTCGFSRVRPVDRSLWTCQYCHEMTIDDDTLLNDNPGWLCSVFVTRTDGSIDEVGPICPACQERLGVHEEDGEMVISPTRYRLPVEA